MAGTQRCRAAREDGFSLVELMVIMIIIGILATIATVTYLNQRQRGEQASAVSTLTNLRLTAESLAADGSNNYTADLDRYRDEQGVYEYRPGNELSTDQRIVSVHGGGDFVSFAVLGQDHCYFMRLQRGNGEIVKSTSTSVPCRADRFGPSVPGTGSWG